MNYGGQDQRYNGGQGLTDGYGEYEGGKSYYSQQVPSGQQQLPSFPFSSIRGSQHQQQAPSHPYHGGLHQPSPSSLLGERVLPPMSSVARNPSTMQPGGADLGVNTLSAAAAAHQMSRLGEAFKDSLVHQMPSKAAGGMGPSPYGVSLPQQQYGLPSTSGHSDRLYGGSANPFPSHAGGMGGGLSEKSSPRSSAQRGSTDDGYGLPAPGRGSGDRGAQLPAPSMASQLGNGGGAAHQAAVSLSHIAGASSAGSQQQHQSSNSVPQQPPTVRTAASMNPKDLLELYSKWDQIDTKAKRNKNEEAQAEEVRKERHNMAEKRRRSDMNGAIDRLKTLLPQQVTNDRRLTKVEVLTEAADHLTQVQNLCAKLITENKRLKLMVPGIKLEDDEAFLTRDDDVAEDYDRERRSTGGADQDGEGDENHPAKRQRRNSPGENSDSNGSGREGEGSEGEHGGGKGTGHSSSGSQSGSGDDERDEIVIDQRGDTDDDDDDDAEGRDSDNSNDGLTGKQRMAVANHSNGNAGDGSVVSAGEPTSFSGLSFPQSSQDVAAQQQPQHHQFHNHHGASELQQHQHQQQHQQLHHLHHQHGGM